MDINYLLGREQESLLRAANSPSSCARVAHRGFATAYGRLLVASKFPHDRFQIETRRGRTAVRRIHAEMAVDRWENEGGRIGY